MPTLAQLIRNQHPHDYDDLDDQQLESLIDKKFPGDYADIPRTKPSTGEAGEPDSILTKGLKFALSPVPAVSRQAQKAANAIEGVDRGVADPQQFEVPKTTSGALTKGLEMAAGATGVPSIIEAGTNYPDFIRLLNDPDPEVRKATLKGAVAGIVQGLGNASPLDLLSHGLYLRGLIGRKLASSSPSSSEATPRIPPPSEGGPRAIVAPENAPPDYQGARLVREKVDPYSQTLEGKVRQAILEAQQVAKARADQRVELPPADLPPNKQAQTRTVEPYTPGNTVRTKPEDGGNLGTKSYYVRPDGSRIPVEQVDVEAEIRRMQMAREEGVDQSGAPRVPKKSKLSVKPRPERPQAKVEDLTEESTPAEVTAAVNTAARKEPEVFAPRNPGLEDLAVEMKARSTAPNRDRMNALLSETVPGPTTARSPILREVAEKTVEENARLRGTPEDVPNTPTAQELEVERQKSLEEWKKQNGHPDTPQRNEAAAKFEEAAAAVNPERRAELKKAIGDANFQKQGEFIHDRAFTPRRKPGSAIAEPEGTAAAVIPEVRTPEPPPPLPVAEPVVASPQSVREANAGKIVPKMPSLKEVAKVKPATAPAAGVPVTRTPPAASKPVELADHSLSNLTPAEQVRLTRLERSMPLSVKEAVAAGKPFPKVADATYKSAKEYERLVTKSKGSPVESRGTEVKAPGVTPEQSTPRPPATLVPTPATPRTANVRGDRYLVHGGREYSTGEVEAMIKGSGDKLPPALKKAIDKGTEWPKLSRDEYMPVADDVMKYTGWRERLREHKAVQARNEGIEEVAKSNLAAASGGEAPKTAAPVVARSEAVAEKVSLPKPSKIPEIPARAIDTAVDEVLSPKAKAAGVRPYITPSDIGPPPKGVDPKMWRTINAVEREAVRIKKEHGFLDDRFVDAMRRFWGSQEAARRLGVDRGLVEEISGKPHRQRPMLETLREMDQDATHRMNFLLNDPKGFIRAEALIAGTGALAGGLVGAAIGGEAPEDRLASAVSLALLGGLAAGGGLRYINKIGGPKKAGGAIKASAEELDSANLLLGPAVVKASLGSFGGVAAAIWQRLREGRGADARRGINFMLKEAPGLWFNTLKGPMTGRTAGKQGSLTSNVQRSAGGLPTKILQQVLRPFVAGDLTGKTALKRMGFSDDEATRLMLNGEPTSHQGQAVLRVINSWFPLRMLAKFPAVRVQTLERGFEFTPGLSKWYASGHGSQGKVGSGTFHTRSAHGAEQLTEKARRARAEFGGAALIAGSAYGYLRDPSNKEAAVASAAVGPAALPFAAATAAGKAARKGDVGRVARDFAKEVVSAVPQVSETSFNRLGDRFKPLRPLMRGLGMVK